MRGQPPVSRHSSEAAPRRGRTALIWSLKIFVSGLLLYVLLSRVDIARLWHDTKSASIPWLATALGIYLLMVMVSAWRWGLLLRVQQVAVSFGQLLSSFLVATFFNNFLPSNIGGDVVRIRDTARPAGSKTLATTVVLLDRGIGLLGLVFVAALGATIAARRSEIIGPVGPGLLWGLLVLGIALPAPALASPQRVARLLAPLRKLHHDWVSERIERLTMALGRFREAPSTLLNCFAGAIVVQATLVLFYVATAHALRIPISVAQLAMLIPLSFLVQMLPISVNGFGVREATFSVFFARVGLPIESALALSFVGAVLIMLFSTTGAVAYLARDHVRRA